MADEDKKKEEKAAEKEEKQTDTEETVETEEIKIDTDGLRWQAALAYLPLVCLIPLFLNRENEYIQKHARQGFLLFMIEILALLLRIDAFWNLIIIVCLAAAVVGALGILLKGEIRIPFLAELGERIKI